MNEENGLQKFGKSLEDIGIDSRELGESLREIVKAIGDSFDLVVKALAKVADDFTKWIDTNDQVQALLKVYRELYTENLDANRAKELGLVNGKVVALTCGLGRKPRSRKKNINRVRKELRLYEKRHGKGN